jgi:cytochrome c553
MKKLAILAFALVVCAAVSANAADAKENWTKHCAKCHGEDGKGGTAMGKKLGVKDYTDAAVQEKMKDEEMIKATKEGVKDAEGKTKMKGFADALSDDEVKALVKHIRALKK